jgi:hypothetical protein
MDRSFIYPGGPIGDPSDVLPAHGVWCHLRQVFPDLREGILATTSANTPPDLELQLILSFTALILKTWYYAVNTVSSPLVRPLVCMI